MSRANTLPTPSIVIEWENAVLAEAERARRMLCELSRQLKELAPAMDGRPEVIVLFNAEQVQGAAIRRFLDEAAGPEGWAADVQLCQTDQTRRYYDQKNYGFTLTRREAVVFLDSDVIPEPGWLAGLLEAVATPEVAVVSGNTYVDPVDWYSRAFALFWFFPLRQPGGSLCRVDGFFANNVAFRRAVFAAHPFPRLETFRGQCVALSRTLQAQGIGIYRQPKSRVSHPAPNGPAHFIARALCQGRDERFLVDRFGEPSLGKGLRRFGSELRRAARRIVRKRDQVALGAGGAVASLGLAFCYYGLKLAGYTLTLWRPNLIERHFSI